MRQSLLFCTLILFSFSLLAQQNPRTSHRTQQLHWKQRKPFEGYWQQDLKYTIKAELDDQSNLIQGELKLEYQNNSPDELDRLYFHLYQNAFAPGSYKERFGSGRSSDSSLYQHTEVKNLQVSDREAETELDNTILIVRLDKPVQSGERITVTCDFMTQFGPKHGRMKVYGAFGYKHFNVVHWYPRISVYDRKFGWTTDQHLGHEFYGDFGSFDVEITLPEQYIMDGTGFLVNRSEVLPEALMQKLDIKNFADKPWNARPEEVIPASDKKKTWKFEADNVHDFAWTADPLYRIGRATAKLENGREVTCIALAQEHHARGWQNAAEYTARIIEVYSRDFGEYHYHKMIVADARDGMEYPMLTLDGGRDPSYRDLLAHEVGHNWFFGMVGNNETYRAALDEGFTQFLTSWAMVELEGDILNPDVPDNFRKVFYRPYKMRDSEVYDGYHRSAIIRDDSPQLSTHSDHFGGRQQYGQVYYKTATMLYNLQYVLGDSLFLEAMQHYFNQWKFCHPYFEDFRNSIIQFTGVDLNWFFDQWLETDQHIDYAIRSFRKKKGGYELRIERKGGMQMPVEFSLYDKDGNEYPYIIPNGYFVKETDATVLPKWTGWGEANSTYTAVIETDADMQRVVIDPSDRMADVYHLDNRLPFPVGVKLDDLHTDGLSRKYEAEWHPSLWYNGFDGLKFGLEIKGDYMQKFHNMDAGIWFSSGLLQQTNELSYQEETNDFYRFQYRVDYSTPLRRVAKDLDLLVSSNWLDGLSNHQLGWRKKLSNKKTTITQRFQSLWRPELAAMNYLLYPLEWNMDRWNNFTELEIDHQYRYARGSKGHIVGQVRSPFVGSDYSYGYLNLETVNDNHISKLNWRTRVFGQLGMGDTWAPESRLFAASANPEQMMQNPFIRSAGFIPVGSTEYGASTGWFQSGGGLGLRGYNNYVLPEHNADSLLRFAYAGTSGLAFNTELEFDDFVQVARGLKRVAELKTYLFADAGIININRSGESFAFSSLRADAGVGLALEIKRWGTWTDLRPTTIRFDMPLFLNRPPASEEYVQFRWVLGIDRAF